MISYIPTQLRLFLLQMSVSTHIVTSLLGVVTAATEQCSGHTSITDGCVQENRLLVRKGSCLDIVVTCSKSTTHQFLHAQQSQKGVLFFLHFHCRCCHICVIWYLFPPSLISFKILHVQTQQCSLKISSLPPSCTSENTH